MESKFKVNLFGGKAAIPEFDFSELDLSQPIMPDVGQKSTVSTTSTDNIVFGIPEGNRNKHGWTKDEEETLLRLYARGTDMDTIVNTMRRNVKACQYRLGLLLSGDDNCHLSRLEAYTRLGITKRQP